MFMVILILSIKPPKKPCFPITESLTYAQDLANASKLFKDLENGLRKPDELKSNEWERIQNKINLKKSDTIPPHSRKSIVWLF
jgi:hypothetical protein